MDPSLPERSQRKLHGIGIADLKMDRDDVKRRVSIGCTDLETS
jgi:hypothetical protein